MEYAWFLSNFESRDRSVTLECDCDDNINDLNGDLTKLAHMALKYNCQQMKLDTDNADRIVYDFVFSDESGLKTFCTEFVNLITEQK